MQVVFIRHATAEPEGSAGDQGRRLNRKGVHEAKTVAAAFKAMNIKIQRILTSPILRAAETAGIVAHDLGNVPIESFDSLMQPGDGRRLRQRLAEMMDQEMKAVALVGHSPALDELLAEVIADTRQVGVSLTKAGAALVELPVEDAPNGAVLRWMMTYEQLEALAHAGVAVR